PSWTRFAKNPSGTPIRSSRLLDRLLGIGTVGSSTATVRYSTQRSSAVIASGPGQSMDGARGIMPSVGSCPVVGLRPYVPHIDAGIRIEPPVSDPRAQGTMPAATAAAEPPLDPPVIRAGSHGLQVRPHAETRF